MVTTKTDELIDKCSNFLSKISTNKFLIAFSGGLDSTVLLDCLYKLSSKKELIIRSIHINHNLSNEAYKYEDHCLKITNKYGIEHLSKRININGFSNIEEQCREKRYQSITDIAHKDECVLTAHHEDDQVETFFLRLIRGSGVRGLSSMKNKTMINDRIIGRPFLNISKKEIIDYQKKYNLKFISDKSNQDNKFDRNYLRNHVIPHIKKRWPSINKNITNNILIQEIQSKFTSDNIELVLPNYYAENKNELLVDKLNKEDFHIKVIIIHEWVFMLTQTILNLKQIKEILKILNTNNDSNPLFEFSSIIIKKNKNILTLSKEYE